MSLAPSLGSWAKARETRTSGSCAAARATSPARRTLRRVGCDAWGTGSTSSWSRMGSPFARQTLAAASAGCQRGLRPRMNAGRLRRDGLHDPPDHVIAFARDTLEARLVDDAKAAAAIGDQ